MSKKPNLNIEIQEQNQSVPFHFLYPNSFIQSVITESVGQSSRGSQKNQNVPKTKTPQSGRGRTQLCSIENRLHRNVQSVGKNIGTIRKNLKEAMSGDIEKQKTIKVLSKGDEKKDRSQIKNHLQNIRQFNRQQTKPVYSITKSKRNTHQTNFNPFISELTKELKAIKKDIRKIKLLRKQRMSLSITK